MRYSWSREIQQADDSHSGVPNASLIGELADVLVVLDSLLLRPDIGPLLLEAVGDKHEALRKRANAGEFGPPPA